MNELNEPTAGLASSPAQQPNGRVPSPRDLPRTGDGPRGAVRLTVDPTRERLREGNANIDPFDIADIMAQYAPTNGGDPARIDLEIDFNWKRFETYGKRDFAEMREYHNQGWREVHHNNFPGRFGPDGAEGPVLVKDMILMERPMRLTVKARSEEIKAATRAMRVNQTTLAATPEGSAPRVVFADRTTREAIEIPGDE
jgi:hypothetical protein